MRQAEIKRTSAIESGQFDRQQQNYTKQCLNAAREDYINAQMNLYENNQKISKTLQTTVFDSMPGSIHQKDQQSRIYSNQPTTSNLPQKLKNAFGRDVDESYYNSDEENEVEKILQQSNRLMSQRDQAKTLSQEEQMRQLQRQKLELLSIQQQTEDTEANISQSYEDNSNSHYHPTQNTQHLKAYEQSVEGSLNNHQVSLDYSRTDELNFRAISRTSDFPDLQQRFNQTTQQQSFMNDTTLHNQNPIHLMSQDEINRSSVNKERRRSDQNSGRLRSDQSSEINRKRQSNERPINSFRPLGQSNIQSGIQPYQDKLQRQLNQASIEQDAPTSQMQIIANDGTFVNQSQQQDSVNHLHIMYLREKPLHEKIRQMRQEQEQLETKMRDLMQENQQLGQEVQSYRQGQHDGSDSRLKKIIKQLQEEVKYLTKINNAQQDRINKDAQTDRSLVSKKKFGSHSQRRGRSTGRSSLHDSTRCLRECCKLKQEAVEKETIDQFERIAMKNRKHSPLISNIDRVQTYIHQSSASMNWQASSRDQYSTSLTDQNTNTAKKSRKASKTPTKRVSIPKLKNPDNSILIFEPHK